MSKLSYRQLVSRFVLSAGREHGLTSGLLSCGNDRLMVRGETIAFVGRGLTGLLSTNFYIHYPPPGSGTAQVGRALSLLTGLAGVGSVVDVKLSSHKKWVELTHPTVVLDKEAILLELQKEELHDSSWGYLWRIVSAASILAVEDYSADDLRAGIRKAVKCLGERLSAVHQTIAHEWLMEELGCLELLTVPLFDDIKSKGGVTTGDLLREIFTNIDPEVGGSHLILTALTAVRIIKGGK